MSTVEVNSNKLGIMRLLLSAIIAVIVSLGLILIFALLIKWFGWGDGVIAPVNIAIKVISIGVGTLIATKNSTKRLIGGAKVGVVYVILSYVCFSLLLGEFALTMENLWDLIFGVLFGSLMGVISNIIYK